MKYKIIFNATKFQNICVFIFLKTNTELELRVTNIVKKFSDRFSSFLSLSGAKKLSTA